MSGVQTLSSQNFVLFELFKFLAGAKPAALGGGCLGGGGWLAG